MKRIALLLALLAIGWDETHASPGATNSASTNRVLMIDSSSMPITAGKVTLIIGPLRRTNGVYSGDYKIKVAPYFYKNEKGRLSIGVSDDSMTTLNHGKITSIAGTATTNGKNGKSRHVDATATPADLNRGTLKLWFKSGDGKMIFNPAYHFAVSETPGVPKQTTSTSLASNLKTP